MAEKKSPKVLTDKMYGKILSIGGIAGLIAMTWQAVERINMLKNPTAPLSCNLNPVVDCGGVLSHGLASVTGIPNAFLGMIFLAVLATSGAALLAGVKFTAAFRRLVFLVSTILFLFSVWFFGASLYVIGRVCIFCVVGWAAAMPIFVFGLSDQLASNELRSPGSRSIYRFIEKNRIGLVLAAYLIMLALYLLRFRSYYFG